MGGKETHEEAGRVIREREKSQEGVMWQEFKKEPGQEVEAWEIHNPAWVVGEGRGERRGGPPFFVLKCLCAHGQVFPVEGHCVGQRSRVALFGFRVGTGAPPSSLSPVQRVWEQLEVKAASLLSLYGCR